MDRRAFLESSGLLTAAVCGGVSLSTLLGGCSTIPEHNAEIVGNAAVIPRDIWTRSSEPSSVVVVRVPGKRTPVALIRDKGDNVRCFVMLCTHKKCELTAGKEGFVCHCHGSEFTHGGEVTKGPAKEHLVELPVDASGMVYGIPLERW